jgi:hypothetical protein
MKWASRDSMSCFVCSRCVGRVFVGHRAVEHSIVLSAQESHGSTDRRTILNARPRSL